MAGRINVFWFFFGWLLIAVGSQAHAEESCDPGTKFSPDNPIYRIELAMSHALVAMKCPGAHYNQAKAGEAIATLRAAGKLDLCSFGNVIGDDAWITEQESKKGGIARVCALLSDATEREPNPFLTFDK